MRWLARHRLAALVVAAAVAAVVVSAWLGRTDRTLPAALDPGNPDGGGAQAVARVLAGQGIDVEVVRSAASFERARTGATTTIVVTSSSHLGSSTTARLLQHQGAADLVVVAPGPPLLRHLGVAQVPVTTSADGPVGAGCPAYDGLTVRVEHAQAYPTAGCFRGPEGVLLSQPRPGLTLLGAPGLLTNDQALDGDNAAVALRLLGQRRHLVWYVPSLGDLEGADAVSLGSLLPDWLEPGLWLLAAVGIASIGWRARRLGPLAREPLPVEVKAVETTRNLGRLYRRSGDRRHVAHTLRSAARARLAERLRLSRRVGPDRLTGDVAARTGRTVEDVESLIGPTAPPPGNDRELADLAQRLTELDREVSHR
jgi:hypothetical protein